MKKLHKLYFLKLEKFWKKKFKYNKINAFFRKK